jgi:hypothetical protein
LRFVIWPLRQAKANVFENQQWQMANDKWQMINGK